MPGHHERRDACLREAGLRFGEGWQPGALEGRPSGRFSRPLGASEMLADADASPAHLLLPRKREKRSYVTRNHEREYWPK